MRQSDIENIAEIALPDMHSSIVEPKLRTKTYQAFRVLIFFDSSFPVMGSLLTSYN